jgi:uncharacterized peroxidase-related enzyme
VDGLDVRLSQVAMEDYQQADLDQPLRALLEFAVQETHDPRAGGEPAIIALRGVGWSDAAILEAVEVIGFFNYYNRLADALGVEPEPEWATEGVEESSDEGGDEP